MAGMDRRVAPLAQLVEHLTLNQGVRSSSLRWCTMKKSEQGSVTSDPLHLAKCDMWPVGQAVKTPASHADNGSSILPRVTIN